jgi:hypothetical protein
MTTETEGAAEAVAEDTTLAPEVEAAEAEAGTEGSGDDAAAAAGTEGQAEQPKPKKTAQERINELTAKTRQAERDAEYWRQEAQRHQQQQAPAKAEPAADDDKEPNPNEYTYGDSDVAYLRDLGKFEARQAVKEARRAVREELDQERAQAQLQSQLDSFQSRMAQQYPDGEPAGITAIKRMTTLSEGIVQPILASDIGPKLADHLGSNPAELRRLSGLSPALQAFELGKLETKLASKVQPKTLTNAPEPTPTVRGAGGQFKAAPDTDDFAAFEKAYP